MKRTIVVTANGTYDVRPMTPEQREALARDIQQEGLAGRVHREDYAWQQRARSDKYAARRLDVRA